AFKVDPVYETGLPDDYITTYVINTVHDYFPYGKILREYIHAADERYLSTQHERDAHTGLDYRGARYYDSDISRFLSTDPWQAKYPAWSTYNYVMGNPISLIDPTGKGPDDPDEKRKKNPSKISASYFGINRSQIGGNINTYLNKDFGYIQPF